MADFLFLRLRQFFCKNPGPLKYMREMGHCIIVVPKSTAHVLFILISDQLMLSYNSSSKHTQFFSIAENNGGKLQKIEENSSI